MEDPHSRWLRLAVFAPQIGRQVRLFGTPAMLLVRHLRRRLAAVKLRFRVRRDVKPPLIRRFGTIASARFFTMDVLPAPRRIIPSSAPTASPALFGMFHSRQAVVTAKPVDRNELRDRRCARTLGAGWSGLTYPLDPARPVK